MTIGVTEIGDGIERDIRHGLAEDDVKDQEVVDRRSRIAEAGGKSVRRLHRETRAEQAIIERDVAERDGARRGVADHLAELEVLEEIAGIGFRFGAHGSQAPSAGIPALPFSQNGGPKASAEPGRCVASGCLAIMSRAL